MGGVDISHDYLAPWFAAPGKPPTNLLEAYPTILAAFQLVFDTLATPHSIFCRVAPTSVLVELFDLLKGYNYTLDEGMGIVEATNPRELAFFYEKTLGMEYSVPGDKTRKKKGAYYTPRSVSKHIVQTALAKRLNHLSGSIVLQEGSLGTNLSLEPTLGRRLVKHILPSLTILDNACGAGEFLLTSAELLYDIWTAALSITENSGKGSISEGLLARSMIVNNSLYGVDRESSVLPVVKFRLLCFLLMGLAEGQTLSKTVLGTFQPNIGCGNSLVGNLPNKNRSEFTDSLDPFHWDEEFPSPFIQRGGFDVVVGNPPYIRSRHLPPAERKVYAKMFRSANRTFDIYLFFVERSIELLAPDGILGLLVPYALLHQPYATSLRHLLLTETTVLELADLSDTQLFPGALISTVVLVTMKGYRRMYLSHLMPNNGSFVLVNKLNPSHFLELPRYMFKLELTTEVLAIVQQIEEDTIPLGSGLFVGKGVEVYERGSGRTKQDFLHDTNEENLYKPYIEAKEVGLFAVKWQGRFLDYQPKRHCAPKFPELFENDKVLLRRIVGRKRLTSTLDRSGYYCENTLICIIPKHYLVKRSSYNEEELRISKQIPLAVATGILNSSLMTFYYRMKWGDKLQIYNKTVELLPLPLAILQNSSSVQSLAKVVEDLLICDTSDLAREQNLLRQLDELVYKLYDISTTHRAKIEDLLDG